MRLLKIISLALCVVLAACSAKPVPLERCAYVGEWKARGVYLVVRQDGDVNYRRLTHGVDASIRAPLQGFDGDNLRVGLGFLSSTIVVSTPPHEDNGVWKMVADGTELTKEGGSNCGNGQVI